MNIVLMDGFDHYAAITGAQGALNSAWNFLSQTPSAFVTGLGGDGKALSFAGGANLGTMAFPFTGDSKVTAHFAIEVTARSANSVQPLIEFRTAANSRQWGLGMNVAGEFLLQGEANAVVATGHIPLLQNQVYRCCLQADTAAGTFAMSINGDADAGLSLGGLDIQDDPTSNLQEMICLSHAGTNLGGNNFSYAIDDVIVGTGALADWGPQEINTLAASADVAVQFTPSAGATNFPNVDDIPFTVDTDYNYDSIVGHKDVFEFLDPPHVPSSILAIQIMNIARKEESAVRKFKDLIRIGGVDYLGDEHNLAETYGRWVSTWQLNPVTGLPFTAAEINALQGGYQLTVVA